MPFIDPEDYPSTPRGYRHPPVDVGGVNVANDVPGDVQRLASDVDADVTTVAAAAHEAGLATAAVTADLAAHAGDSTAVHGIADTARLVTDARAITAGTGLTGGGTLAADRTLAADFGTGAGKITQGNDPRLSDTRTPTDGSVTDAKITAGGLAPSSVTGTAVITTDPRLSDTRTPKTHAASHAAGGSDAVTPAAIGALALTGGTVTGALAVPGAVSLGQTVPEPSLGTALVPVGDLFTVAVDTAYRWSVTSGTATVDGVAQTGTAGYLAATKTAYTITGAGLSVHPVQGVTGTVTASGLVAWSRSNGLIASGVQAAQNAAASSHLIASGYQAAQNAAGSAYLIASGCQAAQNAAGSAHLIASGNQAAQNAAGSAYLIASGYQAAQNAAGSSLLIASGRQAAQNAAGSAHLIASGNRAAQNAAGSAHLIASGNQAAQNAAGSPFLIASGQAAQYSWAASVAAGQSASGLTPGRVYRATGTGLLLNGATIPTGHEWIAAAGDAVTATSGLSVTPAVEAPRGIALGALSTAGGPGQIAIGYNAQAMTTGEVQIGVRTGGEAPTGLRVGNERVVSVNELRAAVSASTDYATLKTALLTILN